MSAFHFTLVFTVHVSGGLVICAACSLHLQCCEKFLNTCFLSFTDSGIDAPLLESFKKLTKILFISLFAFFAVNCPAELSGEIKQLLCGELD